MENWKMWILYFSMFSRICFIFTMVSWYSNKLIILLIIVFMWAWTLMRGISLFLWISGRCILLYTIALFTSWIYIISIFLIVSSSLYRWIEGWGALKIIYFSVYTTWAIVDQPSQLGAGPWPCWLLSKGWLCDGHSHGLSVPWFLAPHTSCNWGLLSLFPVWSVVS